MVSYTDRSVQLAADSDALQLLEGLKAGCGSTTLVRSALCIYGTVLWVPALWPAMPRETLLRLLRWWNSSA